VPVGGEPLGHRRPTGRAHLTLAIRIVEQLAQRSGERAAVSRAHE